MATKRTARARKRSTKPVTSRVDGDRDRGRARRTTRDDAYVNPFTGHGTARDAHTHTTFVASVVTDHEARQLWRSNDIAKRIVEMRPREAMRRGFALKMPDQEEAQLVEAALESLSLNETIVKAGQMEIAYGGSAIYPVMSGVGDLAEPLDETSIGMITAMHLLEPRELIPIRYYRDIASPKFGMPELYRLVPLSAGIVSAPNVVIHESRLVVFPGVRVTRAMEPGQRPGWGDSGLTPSDQVLADYGLAWGSAARLLSDFASGVLKLDGFAEMSAEQSDATLQQRLAAIDMARSALRMMVVDKNDDYTRQTTPITGLAEMIIQFAQRVAASADMPLTLLMGMSPAGMNATGEMDIRAWYDRCGTTQEYYKPRIERLIRFVLLANDGPTNGVEPETWGIEFHPMWSPSEKERAETRKTIAETDAIYMDRDVVDPETVAASRWKGDTFNAEMVVDWDARDKAKAALDDAQRKIAGGEQLSPDELAALGRDAPANVVSAAGGAAQPSEPLNGAQIASIIDVVKSMVLEEISRDTAREVLMLALGIDAARATAILGPEKFKPAVSDQPLAPVVPTVKATEPVASAAPFARVDHIEERNGKYVVLSTDRTTELGTYDTIEQAHARLAQVEGYSKHANGHGAHT